MKRRDFIVGAAVGAGALTLAACDDRADKKSDQLATPAVAKGTRTLKMVTTWPKNFPGLGTGAQRVADRITAMSDGAITVKLFSGGELVPALESFDAVSSGAADIYHGAEYYWQGKNKAFNFFTAVPMGFTAPELEGWVHYGGGQELWDELSARFNIKPLLAGNTGVQMGGWFNKEINSLEDLKGLKIRMPGLGGEVLRRVGAAAVTLPGAEIYPALQSGAIDATEWVGPWNDLAFGFYKITKYYYWPGFHEPGSGLACGVNLKVWESLSASEQAIFKAACGAENDAMLAQYNANNAQSLETLITQHGVILRRMPDAVFSELSRISHDVVAEAGEDGALAARIYESFEAARKRMVNWSRISEQAYMKARDA